jgi:hypothetical protein
MAAAALASCLRRTGPSNLISAVYRKINGSNQPKSLRGCFVKERLGFMIFVPTVLGLI